MKINLSQRLFELDANIRYAAVNQDGAIVEMAQNPKLPSNNPHETDRMEELIANPAILEIAKRRGNLDLDGIRFIVIRYGPQYQLLFPYERGHISIGVELGVDIVSIAGKVAGALNLPI